MESYHLARKISRRWLITCYARRSITSRRKFGKN